MDGKLRKEIRQQLQDSLKEEQQAVKDYHRRAEYARYKYPEIAKMYDHIAEEERHHAREFLDMLNRIRE
jgi:rubrerythrin